jgi:hypothetical protein
MEFALHGFHALAESLRSQDTAANAPDNSSSGPCHTLQKAATVNAVLVVVVNDQFRHNVASSK